MAETGLNCPGAAGQGRSREEILARLQLIRFPNLFTAMADVLAGYLIVAGAGIRLGTLAALLLASSSLYAAGCVLNDIRDREVDARERPFRPLPSGRVGLPEAKLLGAGLFVIGLAAALAAGRAPLAVAGVLVLLILAYNGMAKHRPLLGPASMGACRAANLVLGMAPALATAAVGLPWLIFPVISFCYVFLLTRLSRFEIGGAPGPRLWGSAGGWLLLMLALLALTGGGVLQSGALLFLGPLVLLTAAPLFRAVRQPQAALAGRAVKVLILALPLLDAAYVAGTQGWAFGIPVALLLLPSLLFARFLYVT